MPTPVQKGIAAFCSGVDVIQQAKSGTGKTTTFCLGVLQRLDYSVNKCQAIVLAPTRVLAQQIKKVLRALGKNVGVKVHVCVGDASVCKEQCIFSPGMHVVVGTPDHIFRVLHGQTRIPDHISMLVVDEADEMLSRGFIDQICEIFTLLPPKIQVGVFSKTMPAEALEIGQKFMFKPVYILVEQDVLTLDGIKQFYLDVGRDTPKFAGYCELHKDDVPITQTEREVCRRLTSLFDLCDSAGAMSRIVIYVNTKEQGEQLLDLLRFRGFPVYATYGDMTLFDRDRELRYFHCQTGPVRVLITTDLLTRGPDLHRACVVINYDLPTRAEEYLHRIGRGRKFERKGVVVNFVGGKEGDKMLDEIKKRYNVEIGELPQNMDWLAYLNPSRLCFILSKW